MKRILLVSSRSDEGGGPEQALAIARLLGDEHEFWVALPKNGAYWDRFLDVLGPTRLISIEHRAVRLRDVVKLRRLIVDEDIDIVHTHGKGAGVVARLVPVRRPQFVHTFHGLHVAHLSQSSLRVYQGLERVLQKRTTKTIAVSDSEAQSLATFLDADAAGISTVLNGVATTADVTGDEQRADAKRAVAVLRANEQKNPEEAIAIFARAESVGILSSLSIVCPADDIEIISEMAADIAPGTDVEVVGPVDSCKPLISESTVLINSSRWEGLPLTPLESLAAGTPVLLSDVAGNRDILDRVDAAMGYPSGDVDAAVENLERVGSDRAWRVFSREGRDGVNRHFSEESMARATDHVYASAVPGRNS